MDPFSRIPSPVLLSILKLIPDVSSLRNLDKASHTVASLFDELGTEILQDLISSSIPDSVQRLISTVVIIRSRTVTSTSLEDFRAKFVRYNNLADKPGEYHQCETRERPWPLCYPVFCEKCSRNRPPFNIDATPSILRGIMDSMCRIECLAIRCLDFLIDRCMALEILEPPVEFRYIALPRMGRCPQPRPIGQRVKQQNSGPPSWVELQKAIRCFWRLQLYFDLQIAASSSHLNWSAYDQEQLGRLGIASFWKVCEDDQDFLEEELATVVVYLAEQPPHNSVQLGHLSRSVQLLEPPICTTRAAKSEELSKKPCCRDYDKLNKVTEGFRIARMDTLRSDSPLRYTDRSRFRNCGFFLFDAERMAALGFMHWTSTSEHPLRQDLVMSMSNRRYRWESILSDEELKAIEHQRLAEFPEHLSAFGCRKKETYWAT